MVVQSSYMHVVRLQSVLPIARALAPPAHFLLKSPDCGQGWGCAALLLLVVTNTNGPVTDWHQKHNCPDSFKKKITKPHVFSSETERRTCGFRSAQTWLDVCLCSICCSLCLTHWPRCPSVCALKKRASHTNSVTTSRYVILALLLQLTAWSLNKSYFLMIFK